MNIKQAVVTADSLSGIDLFRDLAPAEREKIAAQLHARRYQAGDEIVHQSGGEQEVYFILSGTVRAAFLSAAGRDVQFRDQSAGEMFGELSAIDGQPRSAEVSAQTDVFLAVASASTFLEIVSVNPLLARRMLSQLTTLIRALSDRVVEFSTLGVVNRIHGELLRLGTEQGVSENQAVIDPAPTQADIAARVSTRREAVSRELAALGRKGVIKTSRGRFEILDVARLEQMVADVSE